MESNELPAGADCLAFRYWPLRYLAIALLVSGFGTAAASAQEEILPDPAVQAPLAGKSLLLDASAADGNFVVVGGRGHILTSTDNGNSWQQAKCRAGEPSPASISTIATWAGRWATTR